MDKPAYTFEDFDKLGRSEFAHRLTNAIGIDFLIQDASYVLLLSGEYGSGKTTFFKMWKTQLEDQGYEVLNINAWETCFDESPMIPILYALYNMLRDENLKFKVTEVISILALSGSILTNMLTGIDPTEAANQLDDLKSSMNRLSKKIFESFTEKNKAIKSLKDILTNICETNNDKPIYILVDELDRVRPDYAIMYLEIIKHFFSVRGLIFVIAADKMQLLNSAKHLFGVNDPNGYLLRFITREASLPPLEINDYNNYIVSSLDKAFIGKQTCELPNKHSAIEHFSLLACVYKLTLREVEMIVRCIVHYISLPDNKKDNKINFGSLVVAFFLLCLYQKDIDTYNDFGHDVKEIDQKCKYLNSIFQHFTEEKIYPTLIASILISMRNRENREEIANLESMSEQTKRLVTQEPWSLFAPGFDGSRDKSLISGTYRQLQGWFGFFEQMR